MTAMTVTDMRAEYGKRQLAETDLAPDPFTQFRIWFDEAIASGIPDANAMTLATAAGDGRVSARIVLLKEFDVKGFCFYTNYASRKGKDLGENSLAALVFFWQPMERQVRIEGTVERMTEQEADEYFRSRPVASQISAVASPQSTPVPDREFLERRVREVSARYTTGPVPRPSQWGGYRLSPDIVEFWQGRENRLHDRLVYRRYRNGWRIERLAP